MIASAIEFYSRTRQVLTFFLQGARHFTCVRAYRLRTAVRERSCAYQQHARSSWRAGEPAIARGPWHHKRHGIESSARHVTTTRSSECVSARAFTLVFTWGGVVRLSRLQAAAQRDLFLPAKAQARDGQQAWRGRRRAGSRPARCSARNPGGHRGSAASVRGSIRQIPS